MSIQCFSLPFECISLPKTHDVIGKRFAFVRFIRVDDFDRLINNLCTLWVGRLHLQANVVRYERSFKSFSSARPPNEKVQSSAKVNVIPSSNRHFPSSFVAIVNDKQGFPALNSIDPPGDVVDIEESVGSSLAHKRICVKTSRADNILETFKVVFKGRIFLARAKELFTWNPSFLEYKEEDYNSVDDSVLGDHNNMADILHGHDEEDYNSVDDSVLGDHNNMADILHGHDGNGGGQESEDKGVSETIFGDNIKSSPCTNQNESQSAFVQQSDDPFGLNDLLDKPSISRVNELDPSLSHPTGFTLDPSQQVHRDSSPVQHNVNPVESLHEESSSPLSKAEVNCHANEARSVNFSSEASTHIHSRITVKGLINRWNGETVVLGDFNEVRSEEERFSSIFNQSCARDFNCFISSSGLVDVKMEGFSFTWVHPSAKKMSKLDHFLVSDGIILGFPAITTVCLDRHLSDHRHILLNEIHTNFGPTPFRTFHYWFFREGFVDMVEQAWSSFTHNDSNRLIRFKKKLQDLKSVIHSWVRDSNDTLVGSKNSILKTLGDIDKALDNGSVSDELMVKLQDLKSVIHSWVRDSNDTLVGSKNSILKTLGDIDKASKDAVQKAKVKWAIEGDENSKFFHEIINKRRSQLAIRGVFVNGDWHTEPSLVKDTFLGHFSNRFRQPSSARFKLSLPFPSRLSSHQVLDLDRNISSDEIRAAVWDCGENKSPGPDGYTFEFFRRYWNVIGPDFCLAVDCFFENGTFPIGCNASFIALIPKVVDAKLVTDFRPISLIGSVYKVVTKILAEFLMCCGLRQCDPLAPLLFILVMETLHISVSRAVNEASGLRINVSKSQVLGIEVPSDIVQQGASRIGCDIMKTPFKYLGVMVGDNMSLLSA
nr:RNA-directed DNA polymerase, eukaryota [Tanacetum cinerariifolium]